MEGNDDRNYIGISDDPNMTLDGKPVVAIAVIIGKKGETFTLEKIASLSDKDHSFQPDMIEKDLENRDNT